MRKFGCKEAARRFFTVLKEAQEAPVLIERHGRPHAAVVSWQWFQLSRKLIARAADDIAVDLLEEAVGAIAQGHTQKGAQLRKEARFFGRIDAGAGR